MNLIKMEFKKNLKGTIIWGLILSALCFLYLAFFPSMKNAGFGELLNSKISMFPKGLLDSLGLNQMPDFSIFMEYYTYVFQFIGIGTLIYAMILGTKALSKEEGDKTIEFLYAKPVSRNKIIITKMISSFILLLVVVLMIIISSLICNISFGNGSDLVMLLKVNAMSLIPLLVYWVIGFVISAFLNSDNKSTVIALGFFFGTYLLGIISNTIDKLKFLKYLSPINYNPSADVYKYFDGRVGSSLNMNAIILCVVIFIIGISITFIKYNKKDLLN